MKVLANVLLESASSGRPVLASRVPGCIETFDEVLMVLVLKLEMLKV